MPSTPYPTVQRPPNQNSLSGLLATSSPIPPVSSANQLWGSGSFSPPAKPLSDAEELKQLYAELEKANKTTTSSKPLPLRGRSGFNKTLFWLILILVLMLIIGSGTGIFYLANANQGKKSEVQQTTVTSVTQGGNAAQPATATMEKSQPSPTATPNTANPYPPHNGVQVINDPLSQNHYKWQEYTDTTTGNSCHFTGGAYHVISAGGSFSAGTCFAQATDFTNFTYQVQMTILQAGTQFSGGGIMFRGSGQSGTYYYFEIYKSGRYSLTACFGAGKVNCTVSISGYPKQTFTIPGFNSTQGKPNTLAVVAHDTAFDIYINGQHALGPIYDGNFTHGMVGVYATGGINAGANQNAEVVFSNTKVWRQ